MLARWSSRCCRPQQSPAGTLRSWASHAHLVVYNLLSIYNFCKICLRAALVSHTMQSHIGAVFIDARRSACKTEKDCRLLRECLESEHPPPPLLSIHSTSCDVCCQNGVSHFHFSRAFFACNKNHNPPMSVWIVSISLPPPSLILATTSFIYVHAVRLRGVLCLSHNSQHIIFVASQRKKSPS